MGKKIDFFWLGSDELRVLYQEFVSEEFTSLRPKVANSQSWEPKIDLIEETSRLVIKAELPGVPSDAIELSYDAQKNTVSLRGHREENQGSEENVVGVYQLEILYGDFRRSIRLPNIPIDAANIRAHFRHGLLIVLIPKPATEPKTITIENKDV